MSFLGTHHYSASKAHLVHFWKKCSMSERSEVIGNLGVIINDVLKEGRDTDAWSYPKLLSILLNLGSNNEGHNKQLLNLMKKDVEWIDFLYFSPLGRVGM